LITIASTLCAVIAFLFAKATVSDFSESAAAALELMIIGLISYSLLGFRPGRVWEELRIQKWGLVLSGIIFGGFEVFLFYALKTGEASKVIPVSQSSVIFTLLAGIFILKERARLPQKIIGVTIIGAGIVLMYLR
jgi:transporter family protein